MADHSRGLPSDGTDYQSLPNALVALFPTPTTTQRGTDSSASSRDGAGPNLHNVVALLPTPAVNDMGAAYTPETWDEWTATMKTRHNNGNGHGKSLNVEAQRLLPTPTTRDTKGENQRRDDTCLTGALLPTPSVADSEGGHERRGGRCGEELLLKGLVRAVAEGNLLPTPRATHWAKTSDRAREEYGSSDSMADVVEKAAWGEYGPAIRLWESLTRPAPEPTKLNAKGNPKLSDEFDEWLMGLPAGWITDVPGITWNEALKACGNGVVPAQAVYAIRLLLQRITTTQAAPTGRLSCS